MSDIEGIKYGELDGVEQKIKQIVRRARKKVGAGDDVGHGLAQQVLNAASEDPETLAIVGDPRAMLTVAAAFMNHFFWFDDELDDEQAG
jgi:hypothetical protein